MYFLPERNVQPLEVERQGCLKIVMSGSRFENQPDGGESRMRARRGKQKNTKGFFRIAYSQKALICT